MVYLVFINFESALVQITTILEENNFEKLTLLNGMPQSLDDLLSVIKTAFGLKGDLWLLYMDQDFGNDFWG